MNLLTEGEHRKRAQVRQAARGSALNLVGAILAAVVSFFTVGLITNRYGQSGAGLFFAATAVSTLAANGARLGGESGLTFFVSRLRAEGQQGAIKSVVGTAVGATGAVSLALAGLGVVLARPLASALTDGPNNLETMTAMIRILAVAVPAFALSQSLFGASRGFGTMRPSVVAGQVVRPVAQLVLVVTVMLLSAEVWPLAAAWAGASVLAVVPVGWWLWERLARIPRSVHRFQRSRYWRFTAPRALADLLSSALERLDILLVAYYLGESQAGLYGASNRLIVAGQLMMFATAQSMAPHLSANFAQGRTEDTKGVLHIVSGWNVTLLWPVFICLSFGAPTMLRLFGDEFSAASTVLVVLSVSLLIIIGLGIGDTLLMMTGDSVGSLINHAAALVVMAATSAVLLPRVGLIGAAWAWALSRILIRGLAVLRVWQTNRIHAFGAPVMVAASAALAAYIPAGIMAHGFVGPAIARMVGGQVNDGVIAVAVHVVAGALVQLALVRQFRHVLALDQLVGVLARR